MNYKYEKRLFKRGFQNIAGVDEAGRGAWAGPLVAGVVILDLNKKINGIKDSKLLSPKKRQELFIKITKNCIAWSIGKVSNKEIDKLGLGTANRLAFEKAIKKLNIKPDYLLVDGFKIFDSNINNKFIVKGDKKIISIAAASIVAKVSRDEMMKNYHKKYPNYNFHKHKGYGTREHAKLMKKHGVCEIHRKSYRPVAECL